MDPDGNTQLSAEDTAALDQMRAEDPPVDETLPPAVGADPSADPSVEEQGEAGEQPQRPKMVPHAAMHEERVRRQDLERQLAEEKRFRQTVEERTNILLQAGLAGGPAQPQTATPATSEVPAIDADPVGHLMATIRNLGMTVESLTAAEKQRQEQGQAAQGVQQVQRRAMALENEFRAETPDYMDAVTFLRQSRDRELLKLGYADPAERQMILGQEALGIAARALNNSANPASILYDLAKERGYKAPAAGATDPAGKLQAVANGQQQARSLGNARGGATAPLTAERLANMSDAEFAKYVDTPAGKAAMGA